MLIRKIVAILFLVAQAGVAAADGVSTYSGKISPHPGEYAQLGDTSGAQLPPHPGEYAQLSGSTGPTHPNPESGDYAQ